MKRRFPCFLLTLVLCPAFVACSDDEEPEEMADEAGTETEDEAETEAGTEAETGEETSGGSEEAQAVCETSCALIESCDAEVENCLEDCVGWLEMVSADPDLDPACAEAEFAIYECLGALTCKDYAQYSAMNPEPYPCQAEEEALCDG